MQTIVDVMLGTDVAKVMRVFAGDVVPAKKPDPAIYELAATRLGVEPARCATVLPWQRILPAKASGATVRAFRMHDAHATARAVHGSNARALKSTRWHR